MIHPDDYADDDSEDCWNCGGSGVLDGLCTCLDDTCCCLHPAPPDCDICGRSGAL